MNVSIIDMSGKPMETIYKAFRVCYSKDMPTRIEMPVIETSIGDLIDKEKITEFIKDKIDKGHESPLEHVSFTFAIENVSRALSHQLVRHRTFKFSQQSQRYVEACNFSYVVPEGMENEPDMLNEFQEHIKDTIMRYERLVAMGLDKEDARALLPNATSTNLIVTCDLRNLRHMYAERSCKMAQSEIRNLVNTMMKLVKDYVSFADYRAKKCGITCNECGK